MDSKPAKQRYVSGYEGRNKLIAELGYRSYAAYLKSPAWRTIRGVKIKATPQCEVCSAKAEQVHHLRYTRRALVGKDMAALVSVCDACHDMIEFNPDGTKRGLHAAKRATIKLLKASGHLEEHTNRSGVLLCKECPQLPKKPKKSPKPNKKELAERIKRLGLNPQAFGLGGGSRVGYGRGLDIDGRKRKRRNKKKSA